MAIKLPPPGEDPPPPEQTISYEIDVAITKINGITLTPNMDVIGETITIEGTARATRIYTNEITGDIDQTDDVTSSLNGISIRFGSSDTLIPAITSTGWKTWSLTVPMPRGNANADGQLSITAITQYGTRAPESAPTTVLLDNQAPVLKIRTPVDDDTETFNGTSATVTLDLSVTDNHTGAKVEWSLDDGSLQPLALDQTGVGTVDIPIKELGKHTIKVRATDHFNNITEESRTVDVVSPFTPVDPADLTGPISYLADLLEFAGKRIIVGTTTPAESDLPSIADFSEIFCQQFTELVNPENRAVALQTVHQTRITVDVLRKYLLKRVPQWRDHPEQLTTTELAYRQQAYASLLNALGTSAQELRRALTGDEASRIALADRLGIGAGALATLLLAPAQISEEALERIFGLADTHFMRDPFASNAIPPDLLVKRRAYLRAAWRQQDDAVRHPLFELPVPIIDPDLVLPGDLNSTAATSLFQARQQQVQDLLKALTDLPGANLAKFEAALDLALKTGAVAKFSELTEKYKSGNDIEPQLKQMYLEPAGFLYLVQIHELLKTGEEPIADEWDQTFGILVQVQKLRDSYGVWRAQEVEKAIALGPDDFQQSVSTLPDLPAWRVTPKARQEWELRLSARIDQDRALLQQLKTLVDSAETVALPVLRDHLLTLVGQAANLGPDKDTAEDLTAELFIDLKANASQKLSRVEQAVETLQGILFALRMGRLVSVTPLVGSNPVNGWRLAAADASVAQLEAAISRFDEEWQWMGSHTTWRSAMSVFLFPENFLQPAARPPLTPASPGQSQAFQNLVVRLRGLMRISRKTARDQAKIYLEEIKTDAEAGTQLTAFHLQEPTSTAQITTLRNTIDQIFGAVSPKAQKFHDVANWAQEVFYFVPMLLAQQLERSGEYLAALDWYKAVYAYTQPGDRKVYKGLVLEQDDPNDLVRTPDWLLDDFNPHKVAQTRGNIYTRYTIRSLVQCLLAFADDQFTRETDESIPQARALYLEALDLLNLPEMKVFSQFEGKNLENPLLQSLRNHASMNLLKLRNGLNIAGLERPQRSSSGIRTVTRRPTAYRYQVLIERAKQLTATAGQIEASFLAALEKGDAEQYGYGKAQQDFELSKAQVQLQNLRVTEAQHSTQLTKTQQDRTQIQADYYQGLLHDGLLPAERRQRDLLKASSLSSAFGALSKLGTLTAGLSSGGASFLLNLGINAGVTGKGALGGGITSALGSVFGLAGDSASSEAQRQSLQASFERREQEWMHQLSLARQDLVIGNQQITLAQNHEAITQQEAQIAATQLRHTQEMLNFLANKFTNADLFDWMSRILEHVYAYFLQQATAIARLAEAQLAFERQEALPAFIQADYWQAPDDGGAKQGPDRRGLTGSTRLLQAITELDQYAFINDRRKLQMSKTFSLAALSPSEFQRFRETGVLPFATMMEYFDRDFPGHYLRLIKQVRTTVLALIPPTVGIHATLTNLGVSRVAINDGGFQTVEVHHGAQSVALTAPVNASGIFELNQQPEMLQPFEAIGVDTFWEFRLPKPANPFDFDTIADVLITIDYTALDSPEYRQQVIQRLNPEISADRSFSFRNQFADQWYDLNHPDQTAAPMVVRWQTNRSDFSSNLLNLKIQQILLYFVLKNGEKLNIPVTHLRFTEQNTTGFVGGGATAIDGIVSTRRGNAANWLTMLGKPPMGEWELALTDKLADGRQTKALFTEETIGDVLLVVTYSGRMPDWPA